MNIYMTSFSILFVYTKLDEMLNASCMPKSLFITEAKFVVLKIFSGEIIDITNTLVVPTPLLGGSNYILNCFLYSQFWPIDIFIVAICE